MRGRALHRREQQNADYSTTSKSGTNGGPLQGSSRPEVNVGIIIIKSQSYTQKQHPRYYSGSRAPEPLILDPTRGIDYV